MPLTTRQPLAEPVERKSFFRETLELWREIHDRYRRKPADIPVKANKPGGGRRSSTPLTMYELLCLLTAEDSHARWRYSATKRTGIPFPEYGDTNEQ